MAGTCAIFGLIAASGLKTAEADGNMRSGSSASGDGKVGSVRSSAEGDGSMEGRATGNRWVKSVEVICVVGIGAECTEIERASKRTRRGSMMVRWDDVRQVPDSVDAEHKLQMGRDGERVGRGRKVRPLNGSL